MWPAVFCLVFFACALAEPNESRLVETAQGPVRGYKDSKYDVFAFYGIPYATTPKGDQKFKAPLPGPKWIKPLEALDKGIVCPQADFMLAHFKDKTVQEDCLIANIYTPDTAETKLPVYVYVHGGAFLFGFGSIMAPMKLVSSNKLIVVSFNYRLGAHGFLCLGTEDAPGNAGMKDQVALLRWVQKNIANFGGNPDDVTIGGDSAGSASVDLLMISKMTDGLFNKVIPMSGANISPFAVQSDPIEYAKKYAKILNIPDTNEIQELEVAYKSIPFELLQVNAVVNSTDSAILMAPCVERETKEEPFLTDSPINILKSGNYKKLPMLFGFADMEGLVQLPQFNKFIQKMNIKFSDFLPADLYFHSEMQKEQIANKVKEFYFGDRARAGQAIGQESILALVDYFSDVMFTYPTLRSIKLQVHSGNNQIYLYEYSYVDETTPPVPSTNVRGATHCAQSMAIMDGFNFPGLENKNPTEEFERFRANLRSIWTNFIITGKPIQENSDYPAWSAVGADWSPHMSLSNTIELKGTLLKERAEFWEKIYDEYYCVPSPPFNTIKYKTEL